MGTILKEKNGIGVFGSGELIATVKGTRKYGKPIAIRDPKTGLYIFQGRPLLDPGIIAHQQETHNIICNEGLILLAGFTIDEAGDVDGVGITYCEVGEDNTAPTATDTTLGTYHDRKIATSRSRLLYVSTISTFWTAAEITIALEEASVWGGVNAAAGEATGLLFAHWLSSFDNTGGAYDITLNYILTCARG